MQLAWKVSILLSLTLSSGCDGSDSSTARAQKEAKAEMDKVGEGIKEACNSGGERCTMLRKAWKKCGTPTIENMKEDDYKKVKEAAKALSSNIKNLQSDDPEVVAKAILDISSSIADFLPAPVGPILSAILSIASGFLGNEEEKKPNMAKLVRSIVKDELRSAYFEQLQDEIVGAELVMTSMRGMIRRARMMIDDMTQMDVHYLNTQVQATAGLRVMGLMRSAIQRELGRISNFKRIDDISQSIGSYISVSSLQLLLLNDATAFYDECKFTRTVKYLLETTRFSIAWQNSEWLKFLENPSTQREALISMKLVHNQVHKKEDKYSGTVAYLNAKFGVDIFMTMKHLMSSSVVETKLSALDKSGDVLEDIRLCGDVGLVRFIKNCRPGFEVGFYVEKNDNDKFAELPPLGLNRQGKTATLTHFYEMQKFGQLANFEETKFFVIEINGQPSEPAKLPIIVSTIFGIKVEKALQSIIPSFWQLRKVMLMAITPKMFTPIFRDGIGRLHAEVESYEILAAGTEAGDGFPEAFLQHSLFGWQIMDTT